MKIIDEENEEVIQQYEDINIDLYCESNGNWITGK